MLCIAQFTLTDYNEFIIFKNWLPYYYLSKPIILFLIHKSGTFFWHHIVAYCSEVFCDCYQNNHRDQMLTFKSSIKNVKI